MPDLYRPILIAVVIVLGGCDASKISRLEKQNQELQSETRKNQAAVDLDMQGRCARDSKQWFDEQWAHGDKDTLSLDYQNHYNKSLHKCFALVDYRSGKRPGGRHGQSVLIHKSLWNVYENNVRQAEFSSRYISYSVKTESKSQETIIDCRVDEKTCKSEDEFDNLVHPYMND